MLPDTRNILCAVGLECDQIARVDAIGMTILPSIHPPHKKSSQIVFLSDDNVAVTHSGPDSPLVTILDPLTGAIRYQTSTSGSGRCVDCVVTSGEDSFRVVVGSPSSGNGCSLFDSQLSTERLRYDGGPAEPHCVRFLPETEEVLLCGKPAVSSSSNADGAFLYDATRSEPVSGFSHRRSIIGAGVSVPAINAIATVGYDSSVRVWDRRCVEGMISGKLESEGISVTNYHSVHSEAQPVPLRRGSVVGEDDHIVLIGTTYGFVEIWDLRYLCRLANLKIHRCGSVHGFTRVCDRGKVFFITTNQMAPCTLARWIPGISSEKEKTEVPFDSSVMCTCLLRHTSGVELDEILLGEISERLQFVLGFPEAERCCVRLVIGIPRISDDGVLLFRSFVELL